MTQEQASTSAAPWWAFWRKRDDGLISPPHRCKPPKCHEWPAGEWKCSDRLEIGTKWECPTCGQRWIVSTRRNGLWKNWEESYGDA